MAEVFKRVGGRKVEKIIAMTDDAQSGLSLEVYKRANKANAVLRAHRDSGVSQIKIENGKVDRFVVLTDERGLGAANAIEYGRPEGTRSSWGPMEGVAPLHTAFPEMPKSSKGRG